ncbi:unnamed protein product [Clonostachys byssicola]|uniref:Uncharacterized protein n=1 Tax=Clonostachys byssicola TaxID=160290 RepID=A0A9N9UMJ8_9HYPO|nr:unnamed protein product [Clonostachys byssicola]
MATIGARLVLVVVLADAVAAADDAEFAFNLLSDVAPVLALFGEQFAKQFMSESLTWFDHLVFAMVPLGILTAITGAIRVYGPQVARSFIGRARESRALAEIEIMSSTSEEVCELFNGNSIVRAMGKPKITQFLVFPKDYSDREKEYRNFDNSLRYTKSDSKAKMSVDKSCGIHSLKSAQTAKVITRKKYQSRTTAWIQQHLHKFLERLVRRRGDGNTDMEKTLASANYSKDEAENVLPEPPNLQLNLSSDYSDQGRLKKGNEILLAAIVAVILQTGLIVLAAVMAYNIIPESSSLMESKVYGFPCYAAGSVLLSLGTGLCSIIVEHSTIEHSWEISDDKDEDSKPRLIWLQQNQTVNDQTFNGFVILAGSKRRVITSRRRNPVAVRQSNNNSSSKTTKMSTKNEASTFWQWLTVGAALSAGVGFTAQFMGLRGLAFPCSIAQIGAIFLMALIRAMVRRRLGRIPEHCSALKGHEADLLATQIVFCPEFRTFSWCKKEGEQTSDWHKSPSTLCCWKICSPDPKRTTPFWFQKHNKSSDKPPSEPPSSQQLLRVRERLGDLCKWTSKSAESALSLARSIELFMNTFFPLAPSERKIDKEEKRLTSLDWWIEASRLTDDGKAETKDFIHIPLDGRRPDRNWKVETGKVDAVLSLWMATIVASSLEGRKSTTGPGHSSKSSSQTEADWRRTKAGDDPSYNFCRIIGDNLKNNVLKRDIAWWVDSLVAEQSDSTMRSDDTSEDTQPPGRARNDGVDLVIGFNGRSDNGAIQTGAVEDGSKTPTRDDSACELAITSKAALPTILAQHLFTHFMWTIIDHLPKNMLHSDPGSDQDKVIIEGLQTFDSYNFAQSWLRPRLSHRRLTKAVRTMESYGLGSMTDILLCMIPALSSARLLPNLAILKLMPRVGPHQEWIETAACYRKLLGTIETDKVDEQDSVSVAIFTHTMDFVSFAYEPYDKLASQAEELDETSFALELDEQLRIIVEELASSRFFTIMEKLAPVYERQYRLKTFKSIFSRYKAWEDIANYLKESKDLDETFAKNALGFSQQHCRAFSSIEAIFEWMWFPYNKMRNAENSMTARDIFGWSPFNYLCYRTTNRIIRNFNPELIERYCKLVDNLGRNPLQIVAQGGVHVSFEAMFDMISNERKKSIIYASGMDGMTTLHLIAKSGAIDSLNLIAPWIKRLLPKTDLWGRQAIHIAAKYGHDEITEKLLDMGSRPDQVDEIGKSPVDYFVETKKSSCASDVTEQETTGQSTPSSLSSTPSIVSVQEIVPVLTTGGSSPDDLSGKGVALGEEDSALFLKFGTKDQNCRYSHGKTLLHIAVDILDESAIKKMVNDMEFDTEAQDDGGQTPLHHAILASNTGVAQALIKDCKACKSAKDGRKNTPLMFAVQKNLAVVAQALLEEPDPCAIDETNDEGESAIHLANTRPMAEWLVEKKCCIFITDKNDRTALHAAIDDEREDVALYLIELASSSEPSLRNNKESLLVVACKSGSSMLISKILEKWPDIINQEDEIYGQSPLSWACENGHDMVVQNLLQYRDINVNHTACEWRKYTPLHFSVESDSPKIIELLLQHPMIKPNEKDKYGQSPLQLALQLGNFEVARKLLLHHGTAFKDKVRCFEDFIVDLPDIFEPTIILSVLQGVEEQSLVPEFVLRVFNDMMVPNTLETVKVLAEALKGGSWKEFGFPYRIAAPLGVPELVKALSEQNVDHEGLDEDNWSSADYIQRFDRTGELSAIVTHLQNSGGNKTPDHKVPTTLAWTVYKEGIEVTPCDGHNNCTKVHGMVYSFTHTEKWT